MHFEHLEVNFFLKDKIEKSQQVKFLIFENHNIAFKVLIFYFNSIFSIVHFTGGLKR